MKKRLYLDVTAKLFHSADGKFINAHGRKIIGWDEILQGGLAPNATVMSWLEVEGGIKAAKQHHNAIMASYEVIVWITIRQTLILSRLAWAM